MAQTLPNPITAAMVTPANVNVGKPRYNTPGDWAGGVYGNDPGRADTVAGLNPHTAMVSLASASGGAAEADYTPRSQNAKLSAGNLTGVVATTDTGRDRGWISPQQPYQGNASAPAAPVVSSLSPSTGAAAALPITVTITGTGFTPYSSVHTGGQGSGAQSARYLSPTQMQVTIQPGTTAGTVSIAVNDHSVLSNVDKVFTVT